MTILVTPFAHHQRPALIRDVASLDKNHLKSVQMVLRAVVKVVKLLLEILQNLCMASHIGSKYQDNNVLIFYMIRRELNFCRDILL